MARQIDIISESTGKHYLLFGWNSNELASFSLQMWITSYGTRAIDWVQALSQGFCTFLGGDIWEHNDPDAPRATLFGERKDVRVGIVANQDANFIKLLDSIGIHSDGQWEVSSVTIPKTLNYPDGMYSKIPKGRFHMRDGVWQSEFLRNMKTSGSTLSIIEAIKGEPLKGYSAFIELKNTDTFEVKLLKVDLNMTKAR
jgi:hypothetical protein